MTPDSAVSVDLDGPAFERALGARSYLRGFQEAARDIRRCVPAESLIWAVSESVSQWPVNPWERGYADGVLSALGA